MCVWRVLRPKGTHAFSNAFCGTTFLKYLLLDIYLLIGGAKGLELHVATGPG